MTADPGRRVSLSRRALLPLTALAVAVIGLRAVPAEAIFFTLDGRYDCLGVAHAVCGDAAPSGPGPFPAPQPAKPPPAAEPEAAVPAPPTPVVARAVAQPVPTKPELKPKNARAQSARPVDPLQAIAARLLARKPGASDLATLRSRARSGDPRALEMLAWCELGGIGTAADPVHAYLLYGEAAKAGAGDASATQRWVFSHILTQEQRQQVLEVENGRIAVSALH